MIAPKWLYLLVLTFVILLSCEPETDQISFSAPTFMEIPSGFDSITVPLDNQYSDQRWELGKRLFFDPIMSIDSSISCASCHKPDFAFSDNVALSLGVADRIGTTNTPSLANAAYLPYLTREGGVPSLEMQILVPIQEHNEFDFNIVLLADKLNQDSSYIRMTQDAYTRDPDPFTITRALACFERTLISGFSLYDQFINYELDNALSESQINGMELFFSERTNCSKCHGGFNFTNYSFENNGLYAEYEQPGRFRLTGDQKDIALFKTPSLRNVQLTAPYMHDGSLPDLHSVVAHYNSGGNDHINKSTHLRPLNLTSEEMDDIVHFLESLTDLDFTNNSKFRIQ